MSERFADIETSSRGRQSLDARVEAYPGLRAKIETMLDIIENAGGDVEKAAVAEQRIIDALRELGKTRCRSGPTASTRRRRPSSRRHRA